MSESKSDAFSLLGDTPILEQTQITQTTFTALSARGKTRPGGFSPLYSVGFAFAIGARKGIRTLTPCDTGP